LIGKAEVDLPHNCLQKVELAIMATRKQAKENVCIAIYIYIYIYYFYITIITINKNTKINIILDN
jgi:hypothetical protein